MNSVFRIKLDFDRTLAFLFCLFAFSISFELVLEILFDIRTVFKPFRVVSLLIISTYLLKSLRYGFRIDMSEKADFFLYGLIIYGLIISQFRMITGYFNVSLFQNDIFQIGLLIGTFFVFKNTPFDKSLVKRMLLFFLAGVVINSIYMFFTFTIIGTQKRLSGFLDNPNYVSLGIAISISYLLILIKFIKGLWRKISLTILVLLLGYVFVITGSRSGLVILLFSAFAIFFLANIKKKFYIVLSVFLFGIFALPTIVSKVSSAGPLILVKRIQKKQSDETSDVRFAIWDGVFEILENEGYIGLGIGQFKEKFAYYYSNESQSLILDIVERGYFLSTHNDYLAFLTDYGLPGLLLYLGFVIFTFLRLLQNLVYPKEEKDSFALLEFNFIAFSSLLIFGLFSENFFNPLFWFILMLTSKEIQTISKSSMTLVKQEEVALAYEKQGG